MTWHAVSTLNDIFQRLLLSTIHLSLHIKNFCKINTSSTSIVLSCRDHRSVELIFEQSMLTYVICVWFYLPKSHRMTIQRWQTRRQFWHPSTSKPWLSTTRLVSSVPIWIWRIPWVLLEAPSFCKERVLFMAPMFPW